MSVKIDKQYVKYYRAIFWHEVKRKNELVRVSSGIEFKDVAAFKRVKAHFAPDRIEMIQPVSTEHCKEHDDLVIKLTLGAFTKPLITNKTMATAIKQLRRANK